MDCTSLSLQERDFLVKQCSFVEILPLINEDQLSFISGDFGPFLPNVPTVVPLWVALYLKSRSKCRVVPPLWLAETELESILLQEKAAKQALVALPQHFYEIGFTLLKEAHDDIPHAERVRQLMDDIENQRDFKIQDHMESIQENHLLVKFQHLQPFEVDKRRAVFTQLMNALHAHPPEKS